MIKEDPNLHLAYVLLLSKNMAKHFDGDFLQDFFETFINPG